MLIFVLFNEKRKYLEFLISIDYSEEKIKIGVIYMNWIITKNLKVYECYCEFLYTNRILGYIPILLKDGQTFDFGSYKANISYVDSVEVEEHFKSTFLKENLIPTFKEKNVINNNHLVIFTEKHSSLAHVAKLYSLNKGIECKVYDHFISVKKEENEFITYFSLEPSTSEILHMKNNFSNCQLGYMIAEDISSLSFFVAKSLTTPNNSSVKSVYIDLIDNKQKNISHEDINVLTRKDIKDEMLDLTFKWGQFIISAHSNGEDIFIGNKVLNQDSIKSIKCNHAFLNTCYGFKEFSSKALWKSFMSGPSKSIIAYIGVKGNSFLDAHWYEGLIKTGRTLGKVVKVINYNLMMNTNEYGNYILIGDPESVPYQNANPPRIETFVNEKNLIAEKYTIIHIKNGIGKITKDFLLHEDKRGTYVQLDKFQLLSINLKGDVRSARVIEFCKNKVYKKTLIHNIDLLKLIPQSYKGKIREIESLEDGINNSLNNLRVLTNTYEKYKNNSIKVSNLKEDLYLNLLKQYMQDGQKNLSAITDKYEVSYRAVDKLFKTEKCYSCSSNLMEKILESLNFDGGIRKIKICPSCGILSDTPLDSNIECEKIFITNIENNRINLKFKEKVLQGTIYVGAVIVGNNQPLTPKKYTNDEIVQYEILLDSQQFVKNLKLKVFIIYQDNLHFFSQEILVNNGGENDNSNIKQSACILI